MTSEKTYCGMFLSGPRAGQWLESTNPKIQIPCFQDPQPHKLGEVFYDEEGDPFIPPISFTSKEYGLLIFYGAPTGPAKGESVVGGYWVEADEFERWEGPGYLFVVHKLNELACELSYLKTLLPRTTLEFVKKMKERNDE